jgi:hypothetical protein
MVLKKVILMCEVKRIAKVGERIRVIRDDGWESSGLWKNPHPVGSEWIVKKVLLENCIPPGMVFVEGSSYGISPVLYEVIEN